MGYSERSWYIQTWIFNEFSVVIPKATSKARIEENLDVYGFGISEADMKALDDLHEDYHCTWNPTGVL